MDELCAAVKKIGFSAIDLVGPKDWPLLKQHGIWSSMCNGAEISLTKGWNHTEYHETLVKNYTEHIDLVAQAGYKNLICFSGNSEGMDRETGLKNCVEGLKKIIDLGEFWESTTGAPIPLGGIVIKRKLSDEIRQKVNRVLRRSVEYAFAHREASLPFVREHAQEMSEEVMYKHIDLYVNQFSVDLGEEGRRAVEILFEKAAAAKTIPLIDQPLFLD